MNRICFTYYNMDSDRNSVRNGAALRAALFVSVMSVISEK